MWNAYIDTSERRWFQRCGVCYRRFLTGLFHEVYDLAAISCEGQCRDTCNHRWTYACQTCTVKISASILEHFSLVTKTPRGYVAG